MENNYWLDLIDCYMADGIAFFDSTGDFCYGKYSASDIKAGKILPKTDNYKLFRHGLYGDYYLPQEKGKKVENNMNCDKKRDKHQALCNQLHDIYVKKNIDYGDSATRTFKEFGILSYATRLSDKFNRFVQLAKGNEAKVKDESIKDTLIDMANYCLMAVIDMEEETNED